MWVDLYTDLKMKTREEICTANYFDLYVNNLIKLTIMLIAQVKDGLNG